VVIKRHLVTAEIDESDADENYDDNDDGSDADSTRAHDDILVRECTYSVRWEDNTVSVKLPIALLRSRNIKTDDDNDQLENDSDSSDDDASSPALAGSSKPLPATKKLSKAAQHKIDKMQKLEAIR
jgi:hypothetical protein